MWHTMEKRDVLDKLNTNEITRFIRDEVKILKEKYGANKLKDNLKRVYLSGLLNSLTIL